MAETVYILMGSNIGDREKNLKAALAQMELISGLEIIAASGIYITEAQDMEGENPPFLNQVVAGDYQFLPQELLTALEKIETAMGRTGKGDKLPRTIDLDILLFGERVEKTKSLSLPHPELLNRPFAMVPLVDVSPELVHPARKQPVADFIKDEDRRKVVLYKDHVARDI